MENVSYRELADYVAKVEPLISHIKAGSALARLLRKRVEEAKEQDKGEVISGIRVVAAPEIPENGFAFVADTGEIKAFGHFGLCKMMVFFDDDKTKVYGLTS